MALVLKDRVRESTITAGTGTLTLDGAVSGFQSFSVIGNGNTTYYAIVDVTTGAWEVGVGTYSTSGPTLTRDSVLESSNNGNLVDFTANIKDVFCTYPAEQAVTLTDVQTLTNKTISGSNNTLSNIGNSSLTNSSIGFTYSGGVTGSASVALGGSNALSLSNVPNSSLQNSSITFGSTAQALGSTVSALNGVSIGASTASTGAFTDLSYTGTLTGGTGVVNLGSGQFYKDASGNVGIGTNSPGAKLEVSSTATSGRILLNAADLPMITNGFDKFTSGAYNGAGRWGMFMEPNQLTLGASTTGVFTFKHFNANSTSTERMRIDSAGNVGIGTSLPGTRLTVTRASAAANPIGSVNNSAIRLQTTAVEFNEKAEIQFQAGTLAANAGEVIAAISSLYTGFNGTNDHGGALLFSTRLSTAAGGLTERMRIDSSGNLLVGTTSAGYGVQGNSFRWAGSTVLCSVNQTTYRNQIVFFNPNGEVGQISTTGSATSYGTSSDYRLKHDIQPMTGALAKVAALKPVTYKWNADDSAGEGFIAHELQEVCPDAVTGEKDAVDAEGKPVYQGIDTSFLVATLTAALQEAHGMIKDLQARVDALEAK